jgi:membrane protein implicated in regulation of membrane protease activity
MIKRWLGLDAFDTIIHVGVTVALMVVVDSASMGPQSDGVMALVVAASLVALAYRRTRAMRRSMAQDQGDRERVQELEARVADLEAGQSRMLELEERVDFAERMLSQQREPVKLQKE